MTEEKNLSAKIERLFELTRHYILGKAQISQASEFIEKNKNLHGIGGPIAFFGDTIYELMSNVLRNEVLESDIDYKFDMCSSCPYQAINNRGDTLVFGMMLPDSYTVRQARWLVENDIDVGNKMYCEDGRLTCEISAILDDSLEVIKKGKHYFATYDKLEKCKEPEYRPFKNAEEFKPYREKWCIPLTSKKSVSFKINWYCDDGVVKDIEDITIVSWNEAFYVYKFEDGTPFGVKVVD